jgi:hypothetical protein
MLRHRVWGAVYPEPRWAAPPLLFFTGQEIPDLPGSAEQPPVSQGLGLGASILGCADHGWADGICEAGGGANCLRGGSGSIGGMP